MKQHLYRTGGLLLLGATLAWGAPGEKSVTGYVDFGKFNPPAEGGEFVEVHVTSNLISMAARLAEPSEPEIASLIRGLKGIHVHIVGLDDQNRDELLKRVKKIRDDLDAQGWERVVNVQQKHEDVGVYLKTRGDEAVEGLAVTIVEGKKQAVLVNIIGDIKPEKVAVIGERFNIEPLKKIGGPAKKQ